jgi:hypothetical protein
MLSETKNSFFKLSDSLYVSRVSEQFIVQLYTIYVNATIEGFGLYFIWFVGPRKWYLRRKIDRRAFGMRMQIEVKIIELNSEVSVNYKIA